MVAIAKTGKMRFRQRGKELPMLDFNFEDLAFRLLLAQIVDKPVALIGNEAIFAACRSNMRLRQRSCFTHH